eukprot:scaffold54927_cov31-Tisochrysis_lutea.AAC.1
MFAKGVCMLQAFRYPPPYLCRFTRLQSPTAQHVGRRASCAHDAQACIADCPSWPRTRPSPSCCHLATCGWLLVGFAACGRVHARRHAQRFALPPSR